MCGILGEFAFHGGEPPDSHALAGALGLLRHRGPDGGAIWYDGPFAFGHRRLAIIDLEQGAQPMATADGALVVTFNGEIYNYLELREELQKRGHVFRTHSDTEVLLHGYRAWGRSMLPRLKGMFAFAIADRRAQELLLARDRFGEKPLFYAELRDRIAFASELGPLTAHPAIERRIDERALAAYLCLNYVPGDATLIESIRRVEPGGWRLYGARGLIDAGRYWTVAADAGDELATIGEQEATARLEHLLDRAVAFTLRSDVPVGVFLSGGIDSSLVSRSAVRSGRLSRAYCLAFEEKTHSEWDTAQETARQLGIPITKVTLTPAAVDEFLSIVQHADDPLADSSALAVWTLARAAARTNKVVIGGDGGDELFGGYLTYKATLWHERVTAHLPRGVRTALSRLEGLLPTTERKVSRSYKLMRFLRGIEFRPSVAHFSWNGAFSPRAASDLLSRPENQRQAAVALDDLAARLGLPDAPSLGQLQRADLCEYLPNDILAKADRMTMAHGLELRAPFLEPELAAFAMRLPDRFKTGCFGRSKRILRALAARTYGVKLARAQKQGFSIPVHSWLRGPGRDLVTDLLSPSSLGDFPLIQPAAVTRAVADHMSGRRSYGFELWGLLVVSAWRRCRIAAAPPLPPIDPALETVRVPLPTTAAAT